MADTTTIAEKIAQAETERQRIAANIAAAYTEAEAKGATMPATKNSSNLADAVASIPEAVQPTLITKHITENGTYTAADDNADGYSEVTVEVPDNFTKYLDKTIEEVNSDVSGSLQLSFENCSLLKTVYLPNVTSMSVNYSSLYLFKGCNNLERINMGSYINIPNFWLQNNNSVKEVTITGAQTIGQYAFEGCRNLVLRELPSQVSSIANNAFYDCRSIPYLDMSNLQQIPTLGSNVFLGTTFPFYFRDQQQLDAYAAATNWSALASRFQIKGATT